MNFTEIENLSENEILHLYDDIIEGGNSDLISLVYCTWYCNCTNGSKRYAYGYNSTCYRSRYDTDRTNNALCGIQGCMQRTTGLSSECGYVSGGCVGGANSSYTN